MRNWQSHVFAFRSLKLVSMNVARESEDGLRWAKIKVAMLGPNRLFFILYSFVERVSFQILEALTPSHC